MDYDMLTTNELRDMLDLMQKRAQDASASTANKLAAAKIAEAVATEIRDRNGAVAR